MQQIILLVFYFGRLPNYFPLFLRSCEYNADVTWRIYTDAEKTGAWPANVQYCHMTFEQCRELFRSRLKTEISLDFPRKLCDFKPAFGFIAEDSLEGYDYWGYCDLDMVFGRLRRFLPEDLPRWDRVGALGNFSLYRNSAEVNRAFMADVSGRQRWREVFASPRIFAFDEWGTDTINTIFDQKGLSFYREPITADVWPERNCFSLSTYDPDTMRYKRVPDTDCIFQFRDGILLQLSMDGERTGGEHTGGERTDENRVTRREIPGVHLQKRKFHIPDEEPDAGYYILPGKICPDRMPEADAVQTGTRHPFFDMQWAKIKYINLSNRIFNRRA